MTNTKRLLELALKGLEAERAKLDDEIAQIRTQLNHRPAAGLAQTTASGAAAGPRRRRKMSAEAKKRISEGMKRRYAELRKAAAKTR